MYPNIELHVAIIQSWNHFVPTLCHACLAWMKLRLPPHHSVKPSMVSSLWSQHQEVEAGRPEYPEHPWINWPPPPFFFFFFDKGSCVSQAGPKFNYIVKDDLKLLILILLLQTSGVTSIHHHASTMGWENQKFRVILCYTRISSPAWATHRPCLKTNKTVNFMLPKFLPGL